jgi:hypothetical protein
MLSRIRTHFPFLLSCSQSCTSFERSDILTRLIDAPITIDSDIETDSDDEEPSDQPPVEELSEPVLPELHDLWSPHSNRETSVVPVAEGIIADPSTQAAAGHGDGVDDFDGDAMPSAQHSGGDGTGGSGDDDNTSLEERANFNPSFLLNFARIDFAAASILAGVCMSNLSTSRPSMPWNSSAKADSFHNGPLSRSVSKIETTRSAVARTKIASGSTNHPQ